MLSSVEQAFVGRDEKRAPLKTPVWEATAERAFEGFEGDFQDLNFKMHLIQGKFQ